MPKLSMSAKWLETLKPERRATDFYDQRELGLVMRVSKQGTKSLTQKIFKHNNILPSAL